MLKSIVMLAQIHPFEKGVPPEKPSLLFGLTLQDMLLILGAAAVLALILFLSVYLTRKGRRGHSLARFGVSEGEILRLEYSDRFRELAAGVAQHARRSYQLARQTLPAEDRRSMAAAELMGSVYWRLLRKLELQAFDVFGPNPTRLSKPQKALLILRTWYRLFSGAVVPNYGAP